MIILKIGLDEFSKITHRENNIPEGVGCKGCPGEYTDYCADALRNLCGRFLKAKGDELNEISKELDYKYGLPPFNQLAIVQGYIELPA